MMMIMMKMMLMMLMMVLNYGDDDDDVDDDVDDDDDKRTVDSGTHTGRLQRFPQVLQHTYKVIVRNWQDGLQCNAT